MTPQQINYSRAISSQATTKSPIKGPNDENLPRRYTHNYLSATQMLNKRKSVSIGKRFEPATNHIDSLE